MPEPAVTGRCLCGAVRFEISTPPLNAGYCHCTRCQRRTGTAAAPNAGIDGTTFAITEGEGLVTCWRHPDGGFEKCFCSVCGAPLFSRNPDDASAMGIRFAAFDEVPDVPLTYRQHVDSAATWEPIPDDGLERFPGSRSH